RGNGPLFGVDRRDRDLVVAQYGTRPPADERPEPTGEMMGMPETRGTAARGSDSDVPARSDRSAGDGRYVLSGMVRNEDVMVGQGRIIAFSFNPLHRFLNHHEVPLVWNALMSWNDMPVAAPAAPATTDAQLH